MFSYSGAPVRIRPDLRYSHIALWNHIANAGPTMTGTTRISLLHAARSRSAGENAASLGIAASTGHLADTLYHDPVGVDGEMVRNTADEAGDPRTVEVAALVSMLSAVDGTHRALGADLEPLPEPSPGQPTDVIAEGLKRRRTHLPVPPGPIPVMFDLLPYEGAAFQSLFGPHYMTGWEMALDTFQRSPGLNRAQMELVSSRTSVHNECFY